MPGNVFDLGASAISAAASLAGVPWQQKLQKELMHENEAINLRQWQRENAYNSPKAQMLRLKEAGLNPDLAIAGNVANTAGSAELTAGTPQAPGAASAVGRGVSNALDAALVDSQIEVNEAQAYKDESQAGVNKSVSEFNIKSMDARMSELWSKVGFNNQQIEVGKANVENIQMRSLAVQKEIENYNEMFKLYDTQRELNKNLAKKTGFEAGIAQIDLDRHYEFLSKKIDWMESEIGLNKEYGNKLRAETSFLLHTFSDRSKIIHNEAFFARPQDKLDQARARYIGALLQYLPYTMAETMLNASKFYDRDKDGNFIIGSDGMPKINDAFSAWKYGMEFANDFTGVLENVSHSFQNVAVGIGMLRKGGFGAAGAGFGSSPAATGSTPAPRGGRSATTNVSSYPANATREQIREYEYLSRRAAELKAQGRMEDYRRVYAQLMRFRFG